MPVAFDISPVRLQRGMLLTQAGWEEPQLVKRWLVQPFSPWRCLGISTESPCFLIDCHESASASGQLLGAFLVPSPEHFLEVVSQLSDNQYQAYRLLLSGDGSSESRLERIESIRSYPAADTVWFSSVGIDGTTRPCVAGQPSAGPEVQWTVEWSVS